MKKRILAVSTGGLGDTILFSPVLRALGEGSLHNQVSLLLANPLAENVYGKEESLH